MNADERMEAMSEWEIVFLRAGEVACEHVETGEKFRGTTEAFNEKVEKEWMTRSQEQ
jgi:hypothetical protein